MSQGTDSIAGRYGSQGLRLELRRREGGIAREPNGSGGAPINMYCGTHAAGDICSNGRPTNSNTVNTAPDFVMNSCSEGGRTSCIVRRRYSASDVTLGLADPLFAGWDTMPPSTSDGRRRALLDAIARKQHELEEFERRREVAKRSLAHLRAELQALDGPQGEAPGTPASPRRCGPADRPREGGLVPLPVSRPGRCVPGTVDEQQDRAHGLFPGMRQRMDAGCVREAASALRGVSESGVRRGERPRDTRPPPGTPCRRRLSAACRRGVLVSRGGLRQGAVEEGCRRLPRHLQRRRTARCGRAVALGQRGACVVLLRCAGVRGGGPAHGLLSDYSGDGEAPRSRHDVLRPAVPRIRTPCLGAASAT